MYGNNNNTYKNNQNKLYTGLILGFLICALILFALYKFSDYLGVMRPIPLNKPDTSSALTLEVNAINNILTWGSFIVATLTIVAAVFGITGFIEFRKGVENKIEEGAKALEKMKELVDSAKEIHEFLIAQQRFIDQSNKYLFKSIYSIADQMGKEEIMRKQLHVIQITNLYRPSISNDDDPSVKEVKKKALLYLCANGKIEDLQHLDFVIQNENDDDIRTTAQGVAYYIKIRNNPNIYPSIFKSSLFK